jgi:hypothetical protein
MSDDKTQQEINRGRVATAQLDSVRHAAERIKKSFLELMLKDGVSEDQILNTRRLYLQTDLLVYTVEKVAGEGRYAEQQLADLASGRSKIYSVA